MRRSLALLAATLVAACGRPQPPRPPPAHSSSARPAPPPPPTSFDPAAIDAYVAGQVAAQDLEAAALVVVREGRTVLARGYGKTAGGAPVTEGTPFGIGSVTKQFTCAAVLSLADEGKLSLDDRVSKYFPAATRAADVTLDDLGAHLSGYPDYYPLDFVDQRMRAPIAPDDLVARYTKGALDFEPRTRFSYSNTGFVMLGRVAERASGRPFGALLQERFFAPLGMTSTTTDPRSLPDRAAGHTSFFLGASERATSEAEGWLHGAGDLFSSASDLARWDLALAGGKLLSEASMRRLATARSLADGRSTDYGCGLGVRKVGGETVLAHGGAVSGYLSFNTVIPRTKSAVILLVASDHGSPGDVHSAILGLVLAESRVVPKVRGPAAKDAAAELVRQLATGVVDRAKLGAEFSEYLTPARLAEAKARLAALGAPKSVTADPPAERGGLEVTRITFVFESRKVRGLLYRRTDGVIEQLLLYRD